MARIRMELQEVTPDQARELDEIVQAGVETGKLAKFQPGTDEGGMWLNAVIPVEGHYNQETRIYTLVVDEDGQRQAPDT